MADDAGGPVTPHPAAVPHAAATARLRPTRFGVGFLILVVLTLVGCINYGLSLGYGLTFLLGGVWVVASAGASRPARGLRVTLTPPVPVRAGEDAVFALGVTGAAGALTLTLHSSAGDTRRVTLRVREGELRTLAVPFPARVRGPLTVTARAAAALDFLGLWATGLPAPAPVTVQVVPAPEDGAPPTPPRTVSGPGDGGARTRGDEDFSGLRPYAPGDPPRRVSWRHVARTGQLLTRETDAPRGRTWQLDWADTAGETETRLSRLAAWVTRLERAGQPFALRLPGQSLPVGGGEAHARAALDLLARHLPLPPVPVLQRPKRRAEQEERPDEDALRTTLLALAFALAPTALRQPVWVTLLAAALLAYRAVRPRRGWPPLPTPLLGVLAGLAAVGLNVTYGTLLGRDAGTALLALLVALKAAEGRGPRDGKVLVVLGLFVTSTHFFHGQDPLTALHAVVSAALLLAAASRWTAPTRPGHGDPGADLPATLVRSGTLLALAVPLALALFVLFPRPESPLWRLPVSAGAVTGLSSVIRAGDYSDLAQSRAVAFRADFAGAVPAPAERYWRGPVYEAYAGEAWTQGFLGSAVPSVGVPSIEVQADGPNWSYTLTLEPSNMPWLLALDTPVSLPPDVLLTTAFQAVSSRPVTSRRRVALESRSAQLGVREDPRRLNFNLALPPGESPRAAALGQSWQTLPPQGRIDAALTLLGTGGFSYTLSPPLLPAHNRVDAFLFGTRQGFCEHYAQAFTFLMRAAGLPARIVGGYLGGEENPDGGYLIVRQQDAHAWAEVWLPGQGWVRVDPTAVVAPARVSAGLTTALSRPQAAAAPTPTPLNRWSLRLDALQNRWNAVVVGYDGAQQRALLGRVGLEGVGSPAFMGLLLALAAATALPAWLWLRRAARPRDPAARALDALTVRLRLPRAPGETPSAYARRAGERYPHLRGALDEVVRAYHAARYAPGDGRAALRELSAALRRVRR
ncbi:transglutaminaseTgpA domain-containing protein [Deinococcus aerophilus]|uniref:Transglutaminase n=1 Tax=Deinococcus aerophilus TaxID=522488 RepID=A0ABQ2GU91_9DEIO|nr:transglutaminaseTgpA domain-containing protein [Deinococcus aerophilus]GGM12457.1 transglutaminase [Deinococcus aerophilus]